MTSPEPAGETAFYEDPKPLLLFLALGTLMFAAGLVGLVLVIGAGLHDPLLWGLLAFLMLLGGACCRSWRSGCGAGRSPTW